MVRCMNCNREVYVRVFGGCAWLVCACACVCVCVWYLGSVALSQVVGEVVGDLSDEFVGVVGVETQHLAQALQTDVLQVTVGQGFHVGVGLDHLLFGQGV